MELYKITFARCRDEDGSGTMQGGRVQGREAGGVFWVGWRRRGSRAGHRKPLCANFPAVPYQLIKEVSEKGRERAGWREGVMQEVAEVAAVGEKGGVRPNEWSKTHE